MEKVQQETQLQNHSGSICTLEKVSQQSPFIRQEMKSLNDNIRVSSQGGPDIVNKVKYGHKQDSQ
tara:strand:- start:629 stop:823 length:195 start_codon:yes stop_codon:yes gene_type:complete